MLAAAPITWGVCELPGWGTELPYERVLDEMVEAGFTGTELGPPDYLPSEPVALKQELRSRGLSLVGAFCPLTLHQPDNGANSLHQALNLAQVLSELECPFLVAADAGSDARRAVAGRVTVQDLLSDDSWKRFGEGLSELGRRCAPLGVRVVFHPHAGTYVETPRELDALMTHVAADAAGLCLDTGHIVYGGGDPVAVCEQYVSRIWHVHAKDVRADVLARVRSMGIAYADAIGEGIFAPLGEGMVDFSSLVSALRHAGYDGWYVLEQDIRLGPPWPAQDPLQNARQSAQFLQGLLSPC